MFADRKDAARQLAKVLTTNKHVKAVDRARLIVLSIPRGAVVIGAEIANMLGCAHDVLVAKKIGFPGHEELAIGAVAEDGVAILDERINEDWLSPEDIEIATEEAQTQVDAYIHKFRQGRPLDLAGKVVILVDDGIATGETIHAAVDWINDLPDDVAPALLLVAVPVSSPSAAVDLTPFVDALITLSTPLHFWAVGQFYEDFHAVEDAEVTRLLSHAPAQLSML